MDVRLSYLARTYLRREAAYLRERNRGAAANFERHMKRALRNLGDFPHVGALIDPVSISGRRRLVVGDYLVDYEVVGNVVRVNTIRHGRQQPLEDVIGSDGDD